MKIGLFLMTKKGFLVLKNLSNNNYNDLISFVCIGTDNNISNDYSEEIELFCKTNSIYFFFRDNLTVSSFSSDYNIAISWRWMLKVTNLIVLHDSLLPKYRGFSPLVNMLINGEKTLGVTAIFASNDYDRGDVLFQERKSIQYPLKIVDAIDLVCELYCNISINIFKAIIYKKLVTYQQNESDATYCLWLDNDDYFIDWKWGAEKIKRKVDACGFPYLGARTYMDNQIIVIHEVEVISDVNIEQRTVGKNVFLKDNYLAIVCGEGLLKITQAIREETKESIFPLKKYRVKLS